MGGRLSATLEWCWWGLTIITLFIGFSSSTGAHIMTMASGDVGSEFKFFFFAQGETGNTFLCETLVNKASMSLTATIKCDQQVQLPSAFTLGMKAGLQGYLA